MLKTLLKFLFAGSLLYWLISSEKLDLSLVKKSFEAGPQWIYAMLAIFTQAWLSAHRYKLLLQTKSKKKLPVLGVMRNNYIGQFFSTFLPGSVSGDLAKLVYVKKMDTNFSNVFLIVTALFDRIMGLSALVFLAAIFSALYYVDLMIIYSDKAAAIILFNFILFSGVGFFYLIIIAPERFHRFLIEIISKVPRLGAQLISSIETIFSLRNHKLDMTKCFCLSIGIQFLNIFTFWMISSPFISGEFPLKHAFTFIPIGFIGMAIPIAPAGLGVGHLIFANLFASINIQNGASLFNLYFVCHLINSFFGAIPFILAKRLKQVSISQDPAS